MYLILLWRHVAIYNVAKIADCLERIRLVGTTFLQWVRTRAPVCETVRVSRTRASSACATTRAPVSAASVTSAILASWTPLCRLVRLLHWHVWCETNGVCVMCNKYRLFYDFFHVVILLNNLFSVPGQRQTFPAMGSVLPPGQGSHWPGKPGKLLEFYVRPGIFCNKVKVKRRYIKVDIYTII